VVAMLFTFALQIGLLILLWQGVVVGGGTSITSDTSETDRLWRQVGQVQRQVCWLNKVVVVNTTAVADVNGSVNCTGAWADGPVCSAGTRTPPSMGYLEFKQCLDALSNIPPNVSQLSNYKLERMLEDQLPGVREACKNLGDMESSQKAFGMGLLFPEYMPAGTLHGNLAHAFWQAGNASAQLPVLAKELAHITLSSNEGCMPEMPPDPALEPLIVNVLAFLALAIYVHQETMQAIWLGHVSAACCGILPAFYVTELSRGVGVSRLGICGRVMLLVAPVLQHMTGLAVLTSSMALTFIRETQASVVSIVLTNVALSFILDLDNRVGAMLCSQEMRARRSGWAPPASFTCCGRRCACSGLKCPACSMPCFTRVGTGVFACTQFWGHVYLALLGLLLLVEPLCLSPAPAYFVYGKATAAALATGTLKQQTGAVSEWTRIANASVNMFGVTDRQNYHATITPGWSTNITGPEGEGTQGVLHGMLKAMKLRVQLMQGRGEFQEPALIFMTFYSYMLFFFVVMLYNNTLVVTSTSRWNGYLVSVQAFIAMTSGNLYMGLPCFFLAWVGMFVVWPLLHGQPTPLLRGWGYSHSCCAGQHRATRAAQGGAVVCVEA
jgi:hypothetical protein